MLTGTAAPARLPACGRSLSAALGLLLLLGTASAAMAQEQADDAAPPSLQPRPDTGRDVAPPDQPISAEEIAFEAARIDYDYERDIVTASGDVRAARDGATLAADEVVWDRKAGTVIARGDVMLTSRNGDKAYADEMDVTESLRDGIIDNLLIVTQDGDRLAADKGQRQGEIYVLQHAAYTPCRVETEAGCPKEPTWQIQADKVVLDNARERVRYEGARIKFLGLPLIPLPGLRHSIGEKGGSGLLVPDVGYDRRNGFELSLPYYIRLAGNRDLTITPHVYSDVLPMLQADYRALLSRGAYQVTGYATVSQRAPANDPLATTGPDRLRGYIAASGKFQFDPLWSLSGSLRYVSDRTFLNRYDISHEDRLRSTFNLERTGARSYLSIAGWDFQSLRINDPSGQVPIALPAIDYRLRLTDPLVGGTVQFQANSLAILRTEGQDTQRAFVGVTWVKSGLTGLGQEWSLTGYARGDIYHSAQNNLSPTVIYRGDPGWQTRGIAALALDMRWPFIGKALGGTQRIVPRVQLVLAPRLANLSVPNEDARAIDLEDSNLFALNRFPGYDRFEDSSRITYGLDYRLDRPNFTFDATIGQSYRINERRTVLPDGTGLSGRLSDIVGRAQLRYKDFISITHRFRLDKNNLAVRRNEIEATVGSRTTYAEIGYIRLNRNITTGVEDLRDVEEIRVGARIAFARYWSVFGSTNIDLTGITDDPTSTLSGFEPVRHRVGIAYEDDCLEMGFTWRRDYQTVGDARRGNSFQLRLVFKNLGL
ncbi:MAG: organic solvent tolerance protein [Sphingobium sp. 66-54]|mgnify:CR=1 FL=1|nr:MAG: organic solvent tolerance protein [Sphingobium sp. 66-54]